MRDWMPWLFSGLGVFAIGLVFAALKYIRRPRTTLDTVEKAPTDTEFVELDSVVEAIDNAPPLRQAGMLKHYVGLRTRFTGRLLSASMTPNGHMSVALGAISRRKVSGVVFEIDPAGYPGLGLLRSGHEVTVVGIFTTVSSSVVWLEDAGVSFKLPV